MISSMLKLLNHRENLHITIKKLKVCFITFWWWNKNFVVQFEEIEKHAKKICLGNEVGESVEPTEEDEAKLERFVQKVREKLADERNQVRREEKQKLFESILKMLNDLYLLFLSIKNSNDEALKVVTHMFSVKWGAFSRWSSDPNSAWGNIETMTIEKARSILQ